MMFSSKRAYVALSRATSLEGLEVKGFDPAKVMAHPMVVYVLKIFAEPY